MDHLSESTAHGIAEAYGEDEYEANYACVPKEIVEDEICESETVSCTDARTTSGNILHRMIKDPSGLRPPCLGKWPSYTSSSEVNIEENFHQFKAAQHPNSLKQMCSLRVSSEPHSFRQPAIVGTIGIASNEIDNIIELLHSGMNAARIAMSEMEGCSTTDFIRNIIEAGNRFRTALDYEIPLTILMDLKGPEIKTGKIDKSRIRKNISELTIKEGESLRLTSDKDFVERCTEKMIYVDYEDLVFQMVPGSIVYLADGQIKLRVDTIEKKSLFCFVENGGVLKNNQRVHLPMFPSALPAISEYDIECLQLAMKMNIDVVVVPVTRNSETIQNVKKLLNETEEEEKILVFAKISSYEGLENINSILKVADGIVIEKNDLCLEIFPEKMFIAQKEIIGKCNRMGKPVLCTAQLSSMKMMHSPLRRMEMNDIAGSIIDGADGVILNAETAYGDEGPVIISQLSCVLREAEAVTMQRPFHFDLVNELTPAIEPNKAIALAAVQVSNKVQAAAILAVTTSGKTAHLLSWFRPRRPVIAITRVGKVARQMTLWRAVLPLHFIAPLKSDWFQDVKERFQYGISYGRDCGIIESGDILVLVSGYRKKSGFTNCIRIVFAAQNSTEFLENSARYYESSKDGSIA